MTITEVANRLRWTYRATWAWVKSGEIASVRVGVRALRVRRTALNAWLRSRTTTAKKEPAPSDKSA